MNTTHFEDYGLTENIAIVDIETLAKSEGAVICSIGCVVINPFTRKELGSFYIHCNLHQPGRITCPDTQEWWRKQKTSNQTAYYEAISGTINRTPLKQALEDFARFIKLFFPERVQLVGNGSEFDNVILAHAYEQLGIKQPWDHGGNQSLRTVVLMGRMFLDIDPKYSINFAGIKHHALDDARHEALYLQTVFDGFIAMKKQADNYNSTIFLEQQPKQEEQK